MNSAGKAAEAGGTDTLMMLDWHPEVMHPDLSTPTGMRTMLAARYRHAALTFTAPSPSGPGLFKASWDGAHVEADTEEELLRLLLEELQDCGAEAHDWVTVSDKRDPDNRDSILRTQRLRCAYCDPRERVITVPADQATPDRHRKGTDR